MEITFCVDMGLACVDRVKIFEIKYGAGKGKKWEWVKFSEFPTRGEDGSVIEKTGGFSVSYGETSPKNSRKKLLKLAVPDFNLTLEATYPSKHEAMYWSQPLSDSKQ